MKKAAMKSLLFFFLLLVLPSKLCSQTPIRPFVEEGKYWECGIVHFKLEGDTVVSGTTYKKGHRKSLSDPIEGNFHYYCAVRQEGKKVFILYDGSITEDLLFDFSLNVGETANYIDGSYATLLDSWEGNDARGIMRHLMFVAIRSMGYWQVAGGVHWMEHIGCDEGPFWNGDWQFRERGSRIDRCYVNGECIFERNDIYEIMLSDWQSVNGLLNSNGSLPADKYDIQGRPAIGTQHPGIYINNGRKRVVR